MRINIEVICQGLNSINKKTQIKKKEKQTKSEHRSTQICICCNIKLTSKTDTLYKVYCDVMRVDWTYEIRKKKQLKHKKIAMECNKTGKKQR